MHDLLARVRTAQRQAWESSHRVRVEELLSEFAPEVVNRDDLLDLIYAEVLLREEYGETVTAAEYRQRFPAYAAEIGRQFEVHTALRNNTAPSVGARPPVGGMPAVPGYRVNRQIGRGAWGVVYEAEQLSLAGRPVALKFVRPGRESETAGTALRREAEAVARLSHPNIARVYDCGTYDGGLFVVLELVAGGTLADHLAAGRLTAAQAVDLTRTIAAAVHHAHQAGIVHRDLKPGNVLLTPDGTPKVVDFGLAKRVGSNDSTLAPEGTVVGTVQYMAPEQAAGRNLDVGPSADVWALGAMLYEMLAGWPPFRADDQLELLRLIRVAEPPLPPAVPPVLVAICRKCLAKRPRDRYPTADDLAADLARWENGEPTVARPPTRLGLAWRAARQNRAALLTGGVAAAVAVWAVYVWATDPQWRTRRAIGRGDRVELVGATGLPPKTVWLYGEADLKVLDDGSGAASFRSPDTAVLELAADPGRDRYRLSLELRHVAASDNLSLVGVFVGYGRQQTPDGWRADRWTGIEYSDWPNPAIDRRLRRAEGLDYVLLSNAEGGRHEARPGAWSQTYPAPDVTRGLPPWRKLVLDVTPEGVRGELALSNDGVLTIRDGRANNSQNASARKLAAAVPGFRLPPSRFEPRRPLGVYARWATLAVRNVVLEPLP